MATENLKTTLEYREGTSDKVYIANLEAVKGGFKVYGLYGRRGSVTNSNIKGVFSDYGKACDCFRSLVNEKMRKGYKLVNSVTGTTPLMASHDPVGTKKKSGYIPVLLNEIDKDPEYYLSSEFWYALEKKDGERRLIFKNKDEVLGINRKGEYVPLPVDIVKEVKALDTVSFVMDGEQVGEEFFAFDLIELMGTTQAASSYKERKKTLGDILDYRRRGKLAQRVLELPHATSKIAKRQLVDRITRNDGEGIVFRHIDAKYTPGRPASGGNNLKWKFWETASFIVRDVNTKRSVLLGLYDEITGDMVDVGNVTIPPNHEVPKKKDIVDVRYLYAYRGGAVYQPIYKGVRTDISPYACVIDQLKFKPEPV